jgi:hypothetical protein
VNSSESSVPSPGGVVLELRTGLRFSVVTSGDEAIEEAGVKPSNFSPCADDMSSLSDKLTIQ